MLEASVTLREGKGAKWYLSWKTFNQRLQEKGEIPEGEEVIGVRLTEKGIEFRTAKEVR